MELIDKKREEFKAAIPQGIVNAIEVLKKNLHTVSAKYETVLLIESHYNEIQLRNLQGVLTYEYLHLEENRIRRNIFDLINSFRKKDLIQFSFVDPRDSQVYEKIELQGITWMTNNLNYDLGYDCWFYDNDSKNEDKHGRLYTWESAKKACPPGWRLPFASERDALIELFTAREMAYSTLLNCYANNDFISLLGGKPPSNPIFF